MIVEIISTLIIIKFIVIPLIFGPPKTLDSIEFEDKNETTIDIEVEDMVLHDMQNTNNEYDIGTIDF